MAAKEDLVRSVAREIVVALDLLQEHSGGRDDGINLDTTLGQIAKIAFSKLWIWSQKLNSSWFVGRMQSVANKYADGKAVKTLFPDAFEKAKMPIDVFSIVLEANGLGTWYNDLSAADRKKLIS